MFAVRDQENVLPARPAGKQASGGADTNLHKTPFRSQRDAGSGPLKAKFGGVKDAATPAATGRLPLGLKTTNAKAQSFQTPLLNKQRFQSAKGSSPRLRRPKIQVLQADSDVQTAQDEDEREIEYMAPTSVLRAALPDNPYDEFQHGRTFPQFQGQNMTRGWSSFYGTRTSHLKRDLDEENDDEAANKSAQEALDRLNVVKKRLRSHHQPRPTLRSSSRQPSQESLSHLSRLTRPTLSSAARSTPTTRADSIHARPSSRLSDHQPLDVRMPPVSAPSPTISHSKISAGPSHTASISKATIGYARGRSTSAQIRKHDVSYPPTGGSRPPISGLNFQRRPFPTTSTYGRAASIAGPTPGYRPLSRSQSKTLSRPSSRTHSVGSVVGVGVGTSIDPDHEMRDIDLTDDDDDEDAIYQSTDDDADAVETRALARLLAQSAELEKNDGDHEMLDDDNIDVDSHMDTDRSPDFQFEFSL